MDIQVIPAARTYSIIVRGTLEDAYAALRTAGIDAPASPCIWVGLDTVAAEVRCNASQLVEWSDRSLRSPVWVEVPGIDRYGRRRMARRAGALCFYRES